MAIPSNTSTRPEPASCSTARTVTLSDQFDRVAGVCPYTVYTRDADDVTAWNANGPSMNFALRLNSMYGVLI